jgi:Peptidase family M1 domain/Secretion system C-terminal sorting domain
MSRKLYLFCIALCTLFSLQSSIAQTADDGLFYHGGARLNKRPVSEQPITGRSTGQSGTGGNIDVKYHKIWWRINPDSIVTVSSVNRGYIKGWVQTNFLTTQANVSAISFDIYSGLTIDSVRFRGAKLTAGNIVRSGNIVTLTLGATLANNIMDSIWIYYKGITPAVSGAAQGYQPDTDPTTGQNMIFTLSESYEDRDWWPCKADMQDKIDSMDINVNVPWSGADTFWVASNGRLVDSAISGSSRTFTFKNRYAMASYLVAVSVARYNRYYTSVNVSGVNTQVAYYLHRGKSASNYTTIINAMNQQNLVLQAFSTKYGDYPYKYEKHGFYDGLKGAGGMEHQTFSAIDGGTTSGSIGALADPGTLAHELMHQWFGDKATFATWADIYLAEGFAKYGESLAGELVPATGINPVTLRSTIKGSARSITTTSTQLTSYATSAQVWSPNNNKAMYNRGCMVVSMLRMLCGDNLFFQGCRNYLDSTNGSGYRSATTDSLKNNLSRVMSNYNLTPFFNDWVIGTGHPTTQVDWTTQVGNPKRLVVSINNQTKSASSSVSYFHNVVVIRVQGAIAANDTLITFYDIDGNNLAKAGLSTGIAGAVSGNMLMFDLSFAPTTVTFDPYNQTMSAGLTNKLAVLATDVLSFSANKASNGNTVQLNITSTEPLSKVVLEKSSDGVKFYTEGEMQQTVNNGAALKYQFADLYPYSPATFYRAKIYAASGRIQYSSIAKVQENINGNITILPNPANEAVNIGFANNNGEKITVRIINAEGKIVNEPVTTNNYIHIDTQKLSAGTYVAQVINQGKVTAAQKFVVYH